MLPSTLETRAFLSLQRAADRLMTGLAILLKPTGLSPTQYNVLRILRGAGEAGLACHAIGDRLLTRDPDITRLLDRLEKRGMLARTRETHDRRVITVRITQEGLDLLAPLDSQVTELHRAQAAHLGEGRLGELISALDELRPGADG
jgi:DNA-binding MarR family transcriptional regulator